MVAELSTRQLEEPPAKKVAISSEFRPQVLVRVASGVAKSSVETKITEIVEFLQSNTVQNWKTIKVAGNCPLEGHIVSATIGCNRTPDGQDLTSKLLGWGPLLQDFHFYKPNTDGPLSQELCLEDSSSSERTVGSQLWTLPCVEFENIWESLFYSTNLKNEILSYVYSLIRLSERGADHNVITVNRMAMLLGPPGTGKTSLCKAVAQLLSIRLDKTFPRSVMFEVNSHSLFSKWFSESGKLVQKMFDQIDEMAEDKKCMVFVLIDEVESLGMSRESSSKRGDPADSIRAVNALLTQIDRIRRRQNVLILCTSNLSECLDPALVDRTDFMRHVGQPSQHALYTILHGCVEELQRIGLVSDSKKLAPLAQLDQSEDETSRALWDIASEAIGLSGRGIRQIPALAMSMAQEEVSSVEDCLDYIRAAVQERKARDQLKEKSLR